jgi:hypothetical protein
MSKPRSLALVLSFAGLFGFGCSSESTNTADTCYSPTQNLDLARDGTDMPKGRGCACAPTDKGVCVDGVALICNEGRWLSVIDGPCSPGPSSFPDARDDGDATPDAPVDDDATPDGQADTEPSDAADAPEAPSDTSDTSDTTEAG